MAASEVHAGEDTKKGSESSYDRSVLSFEALEGTLAWKTHWKRRVWCALFFSRGNRRTGNTKSEKLILFMQVRVD